MTGKRKVAGNLSTICALLLLLVPSVSRSESFEIDTSSNAPLTGLWWNELESGWGVTLTQQVEIIFVTIFTYDSNGIPIWYVASNCTILIDDCSGELFEISGGTIVTNNWDGTSLSVEAVGDIRITFTDSDTAIMDFTIDGMSSSKAITRQVWSTLSPGASMTALWWNELESGWGMTVTQQTNIAFATMFTYDTNGFPTWFVASNCEVSGSTCSGELFAVTGGASLTEPWVGANLIVIPVGNIEVAITGEDAGSTSFDIDGISGSKLITRQIWALDDDGDGVSNNFDAFPDDPLKSTEDDDDASTGGIWTGTITSNQGVDEFLGISTDDGKFRFFSLITRSELHGNISVSNNELSGTGFGVFDGENLLTITLNGQIKERQSITGSWSASTGESGNLDFQYLDVYTRSSSIEKLNGGWTGTDDGLVWIELAINNGAIGGTDILNCEHNGTITILDPMVNAYLIEDTVSNCPISGEYIGLAALNDTVNANDTLMFAVDNGTFLVSGELIRD